MAARLAPAPFPGVPADALVAWWNALTGDLGAVSLVIDGAALGVDATGWRLDPDHAAEVARQGLDPAAHFTVTLTDLLAVHDGAATRFADRAGRCPVCASGIA
jgi:hypothetical protein